MDDIFFGDVRILFIKIGNVFLPIGCLTSNPLSEGVDMIKTTTRTSNGWKTSIPTNQFYGITFQGIQILSSETDEDGKISYDYLKVLKRARTKIEWKISSPSNNFTDSGEGYITSLGESNDSGEVLTFDGEIEGHGEPVLDRGTITGDLFQNGNGFLLQNGNNMIFN